MSDPASSNIGPVIQSGDSSVAVGAAVGAALDFDFVFVDGVDSVEPVVSEPAFGAVGGYKSSGDSGDGAAAAPASAFLRRATCLTLGGVSTLGNADGTTGSAGFSTEAIGAAEADAAGAGSTAAALGPGPASGTLPVKLRTTGADSIFCETAGVGAEAGGGTGSDLRVIKKTPPVATATTARIMPILVPRSAGTDCRIGILYSSASPEVLGAGAAWATRRVAIGLAGTVMGASSPVLFTALGTLSGFTGWKPPTAMLAATDFVGPDPVVAGVGAFLT